MNDVFQKSNSQSQDPFNNFITAQNPQTQNIFTGYENDVKKIPSLNFNDFEISNQPNIISNKEINQPKEETKEKENGFSNLWDNDGAHNRDTNKPPKKLGFGFDDFDDMKMDTQNEDKSFSIDPSRTGFDFDYDTSRIENPPKHVYETADFHPDDNKIIFDPPQIKFNDQEQPNNGFRFDLGANDKPFGHEKKPTFAFNFGGSDDAHEIKSPDNPFTTDRSIIKNERKKSNTRSHMSNITNDTLIEELNNEIDNVNPPRFPPSISVSGNPTNRRYESTQDTWGTSRPPTDTMRKGNDFESPIDKQNLSIISASQALHRSMIRFDELVL